MGACREKGTEQDHGADRPAASARWKPERHQDYWYLNAVGTPSQAQWGARQCDEQYWEFGNCFSSKQDAAQAREKIREILLNLRQGPGLSR